MRVLDERRSSLSDRRDSQGDARESRRYSIASNQEEALDLPNIVSLNPYADCIHTTTWQPLSGIVDSKESLYLRQSVRSILDQIQEHVSPRELEIRANTPEYRLENEDWIGHKNSKNVLPSTLKCVARLPMSLLTVIPERPVDPFDIITGHMSKRGSTNTAFKRRYFELEQKVLSYYRSEPTSSNNRAAYVKGTIPLETVTAIQPHSDDNVAWGFELVTPTRTWILSAESEEEYVRWVEAICHNAEYNSVNIVFRRMVQLPEVSANGVNEVRMNILASNSVADTVEHIFDMYLNKINSVPLLPYEAKDFALKVTGYRDYMIDPAREISNYQHVRECLLTKKTLCLTVVHRSTIDGPEVLQGFGGTSEDNSDLVNMTTLEFPKFPKNEIIPSAEYHEPLRFCINRVLNIPKYTVHVKRDAHELGFENRPLLFSNVIVVIELYNGGKRLEKAIEIADVRLKSIADGLLLATWGEQKWYRTKTSVKDMPRSARLVLTLYGVRIGQGGSISGQNDGSDRERILTTGVNVFDVEGLLVQGDQYIQMLNNMHHCHYGAVPHVLDPQKPLIYMSFASYHTQIGFDWSMGNLEKSDIDENVNKTSQRSVVLEKSGWLQKTGKFHSLSSWQRRWFSLSQTSQTLTYAEDPEMPVKGIIDLRGAVVSPADDLNSRYTTYVTSTSTKKELNTWVFKIKPESTNREFVVSANTKQEREEWMTAIGIVARGETFTELAGDNSTGSQDEESSPTDNNNLSTVIRYSSVSNWGNVAGSVRTLDDLRNTMTKDPLYKLNPYEKAILWKFRHEFMNDFDVLPRFLSCVNWNNSREVEEVVSMLPFWGKANHPAAYIRLLDMEFANQSVREFAVQKLSEMADTTFSYFLPQLVQALKYENHHASPLAKHLIKRAIENPNQIGFDLFWAMKVESYNEQYRERYGLLLNTYVEVCSHKMRAILKLQDALFSEGGQIDQICQLVKQLKQQNKSKDEMKAAMCERLVQLNETLSTTYQLPIDPRVEVGKVLVNKCKIMSSAKLPLWLEFENAEEGGDPVVIIFKAGDDIRQDCLTLQLIRLMDEMWRDEGKDLAMEPYKCVSTGPMTGIVQVVLHSVTTAAIHKRKGGALGAFDVKSFSDWIEANNCDRSSYKHAVDLFLRSAAGYCVATYVLGIGDRHNDNIMMTKRFMKYQFGFKREQTPFVFTPEMKYVLSPKDGKDEFPRFIDTSAEAFNVVRRHMHLLVTLLLLMIPANMPELRDKDDINYVVQVLQPDMQDDEAAAYLGKLTIECMKSTMKRIDNLLHIIKHR
ncbi:unnamed protein product [Aphanomyces euteiches]